MSTLTSLPTANSYEGMFVTALNFEPLDFNFYQTRPPVPQNLALTANQLEGAFVFSSTTTNVSKASLSLNSGAALNQFSIECWVKSSTNNTGSSKTILSYQDPNGIYIYLRNPANLSLANNAGTHTSGASLLDGLWHHIAIVFELNEPVKFYFDTREMPLSSTYTYSTAFADAGTLIVGSYTTSTSSSFTSYYFGSGMIGQVRLWAVARSQMDIIYAAGRYLYPSEMRDLSLYWSLGYNASTKIISDSSYNGNDGTVVTTQNTVWDYTTHYGALLDPSHLAPHIINMTGNAVMSVTVRQFFSKAVEQIFAAITLECWIKADSGNTADAEIMGLYDTGNSAWVPVLQNPGALTIHFSSTAIPDITTAASLLDGKWHHVAICWASGHVPLLYLDTVLVPSNNTTAPVAANYTLSSTIKDYKLVLGGSNNSSIFGGGLSEFRCWTEERSAEQVLQDASYRLTNTQDGLLVYWPFGRSFSGAGSVEDLSGNSNNGIIHSSPTWADTELFGLLAEGFPVAQAPDTTDIAGPPISSWQYGQVDLSAVVSERIVFAGAIDGFPAISGTALEAAFTDAHDAGYFSPSVFPNIYFGNDDDRDAAQTSIADLTSEVFMRYWALGRRLSFYRNTGGDMCYKFIVIPPGATPTLFLLLDTRISCYFGDLGEGQVVRTFSLMPGESTYASIETYKNTSENEEQTSSIFDSNSSEAQQSFQNSLDMEAGIDGGVAAAFEAHASAETKDRWGFGNADIKGDASLALNANIQAHLQTVSNAMQSHASQKSAERNVEVNTSYTVTTESGSETSITREFKNINNSKTLNILFRQMNQEFKIIHAVTNIRVGYYDPSPGSYRAVQLLQLDDLLDQVLVDDATKKLDYKTKIITAAGGVNHFNTGSLNNFIMYLDKSTGQKGNIQSITATDGSIPVTADMIFYINYNSITGVQLVSGQPLVNVPGHVLSTDSIVMRTDNVVADLVMGAGTGLDEYAQSLQTQAVQRETVENQRIQLENDRLIAGLGILKMAHEGGSDASALAQLYRELFVATAPNKTVIYKNGADAQTE